MFQVFSVMYGRLWSGTSPLISSRPRSEPALVQSCVAIDVAMSSKNADHVGDIRNTAFHGITLTDPMPALSAMLIVRWMDYA